MIKQVMVLLGMLSLLVLGSMSVSAEYEPVRGEMTREEYSSIYSDLNAIQNQAWNDKHGFRPETNVVEVSTPQEFKEAFEDNTVSKIVLMNNIKTPRTAGYDRKESLELDGQGFLLEMVNGSLNVDSLRRLSDFTKNFSDVPVFHMHDIQIINNTGYGALEGTLTNAWSFINGYGEFNGKTTGKRGLWEYRIGNILTPYDASKPNTNQRVGGRLIGGNNANISVWGYNEIVTGAENFYTGGMEYEPYSYHRGEIAWYNYSTVWFILEPNHVTDAENKLNLTGTQDFITGEGSFVYLHNTNTGKLFPAIYSAFKQIIIGENATFNANVAGTAVSFNLINSSFRGKKGSKVNLLSRAKNEPTIRLKNTERTEIGGENYADPMGITFDMEPGSELYVVGNVALSGWGVIDLAKNGGRMTIDTPKAFDIRNLAENPFLTYNTNGKEILEIKNTDISLWRNKDDLFKHPSITQPLVDFFNVKPLDKGAGIVESSDPYLKEHYKRDQYRRISGFNIPPTLEWYPATDAQFSQKGRVFLGNVPVGGENPFDENGNPYLEPTYADDVMKGYVDFTDTLGNTYKGVTSEDKFVHWKKEDHRTPGFQKVGQSMSGVPFKETTNSAGETVRYLEGEEATTPVLDITPPEPTSITGEVTNVSSAIKGKSEEPNVKVSFTVNGVSQQQTTLADGDGNWVLNFPVGTLKKEDTVQVFLQDNADYLAEVENIGTMPVTHLVDGNINPSEELNHEDATFKAATTLVVKDVTPPTPTIKKTVRSLTLDETGHQIPQVGDDGKETTLVGSTLSYRLVMQIPGTVGEDQQRILYNAHLSDDIPAGLSFDKKNVKVWKYTTGDGQGFPIVHATDEENSEGERLHNKGDIDLAASNATPLDGAKITYNEKNRRLTVGIGDTSLNNDEGTYDGPELYGYEGDNTNGILLPGDKVVVEFPTEVTRDNVDTVVTNTGIVIGYSPEKIAETEYKELKAESEAVVNPGDKIEGSLKLISAPDDIRFGDVKIGEYQKTVGVNKDAIHLGEGLTVEDTRANQKTWRLIAKVVTDMTYREENTVIHTLENSLMYRYNKQNKPLLQGEVTEVFNSANADNEVKIDDDYLYRISDYWQKEADKDGLKLQASKLPQAKSYTGTIEWQIQDVVSD